MSRLRSVRSTVGELGWWLWWIDGWRTRSYGLWDLFNEFEFLILFVFFFFEERMGSQRISWHQMCICMIPQDSTLNEYVNDDSLSSLRVINQEPTRNDLRCRREYVITCMKTKEGFNVSAAHDWIYRADIFLDVKRLCSPYYSTFNISLKLSDLFMNFHIQISGHEISWSHSKRASTSRCSSTNLVRPDQVFQGCEARFSWSQVLFLAKLLERLKERALTSNQDSTWAEKHRNVVKQFATVYRDLINLLNFDISSGQPKDESPFKALCTSVKWSFSKTEIYDMLQRITRLQQYTNVFFFR